jgi:hypothetical protein
LNLGSAEGKTSKTLGNLGSFCRIAILILQFLATVPGAQQFSALYAVQQQGVYQKAMAFGHFDCGGARINA